MPSSHNSIIYEVKALKRHKFKERYLCAADYEQYLALKKSKHRFVYSKRFKITNINANGFIAKNKIKSYIEYIDINYLYQYHIVSQYWQYRLFILKLLKRFNSKIIAQ